MNKPKTFFLAIFVSMIMVPVHAGPVDNEEAKAQGKAASMGAARNVVSDARLPLGNVPRANGSATYNGAGNVGSMMSSSTGAAGSQSANLIAEPGSVLLTGLGLLMLLGARRIARAQ